MEAELFHADRQTNIHVEANNRFSKFCEASKTHELYKYSVDKVQSVWMSQYLVFIITTGV
jgi:hypothetical protein